jgi:hypothetical protein
MDDLSLLKDNHASHSFFIETDCESESEALSDEDSSDQPDEKLIITLEEARNQLS